MKNKQNNRKYVKSSEKDVSTFQYRKLPNKPLDTRDLISLPWSLIPAKVPIS